MAIASLLLWWLFDRSKNGLGLAVLVTICACVVLQCLIYLGVYRYSCNYTFLLRLFSSREYPYPLQGWSLKFPRGRGVLIAKFLKENMNLPVSKNSRGWEGSNQRSILRGGVDIFGTTHFNSDLLHHPTTSYMYVTKNLLLSKVVCIYFRLSN